MTDEQAATEFAEHPVRAEIRDALADPQRLDRLIATGRTRGSENPHRRAEARYVDLRDGTVLQITTYDETQAFTHNHSGAGVAAAVDDLLGSPFATWHLDTVSETVQVRITKKGKVLAHRTGRDGPPTARREHDRQRQRAFDRTDTLWRVLGIADADGVIKPSRTAKLRQVEQFVGQLRGTVQQALDAGHLRRPTPDEPLVVTDLGCGNGYLTLAAARLLQSEDLPAVLVGVDSRADARERNAQAADELGLDARFVDATIADAEVDPAPDVVLALHACDTATDDALARALGWGTSVVLAAPCCHHDVSAQLRRVDPPPGHRAMVRDGILRERFADTLTDAVRASLMRLNGYTVDVTEFVDSKHTPRNTLLRAVRTGRAPDAADRADYRSLVEPWGLRPALSRSVEVPT